MSNVIGKIVRREKMPDGKFERQIIIGMIISSEYLQGIVPIYQSHCLRIPFAETIARWCLEYFDKYKVSPGRHIEDIFKDQKDSIQDPDEAKMIEDFLIDISDEYVKGETFNAKYILDKTEKRFRILSIKNLIKEMERSLIGGNVEEAEALTKKYERITRIQTQGVDPIMDTKVIADSLNEDSGDKLFKLPGILGETIGALERGWLFSFIGASGSGKTWWLMLTALRALFAGYNVVFISMEMSQKQMTSRIQHWINSLPTRKWAGTMRIPVFDCKKKSGCHKVTKTNEFCTACINTKEFEFGTGFKNVSKEELTIPAAIQKRNAIKKSGLIRGNSFKLVTFPSKSITMSGIKTYLHNQEYYNGFIPDVIVTDYADKVKEEDSRLQYRHQVASIWEGHKALAQERNCLVVTASQSNTARTGKDIKQGDWSEAIAKLELSDAGMAINMSPVDKDNGVMRALLVKQRHDYFSLTQEIAVLHQLKIGKPYLNSCLLFKDEKEKE